MKIWYFINYWKIVLQDNNISGKYSQEGFNFIKKKKQALIHKPLLSLSLSLSPLRNANPPLSHLQISKSNTYNANFHVCIECSSSSGAPKFLSFFFFLQNSPTKHSVLHPHPSQQVLFYPFNSTALKKTYLQTPCREICQRRLSCGILSFFLFLVKIPILNWFILFLVLGVVYFSKLSVFWLLERY